MTQRKGATSGSPPRVGRDRHQSRAARAKKANLHEDPQVIAWVAYQYTVRPNSRDEILRIANAGKEGWPRRGVHLSKGVLNTIKKVVDASGVPGVTPIKVKQNRVRTARTQMEELAESLVVKSRAITQLANLSQQGATLQALLYNLDLAELNALDDKTLRPFLDSAFVNLVDLMEVASLRIGEFQARASEDAVRAKIAIMRNPAGRTEHEMANANAIADRLERALGDGLKLVPGET